MSIIEFIERLFRLPSDHVETEKRDWETEQYETKDRVTYESAIAYWPGSAGGHDVIVVSETPFGGGFGLEEEIYTDAELEDDPQSPWMTVDGDRLECDREKVTLTSREPVMALERTRVMERDVVNTDGSKRIGAGKRTVEVGEWEVAYRLDE